jgi:hypothetical protein
MTQRCQIGTDLTCLRCGRLASHREAVRNCRPRPGLGDLAAQGLASVGITKERVAAALGVRDCGCDRRRELLNKAGYWLGIGTPPPPPTGPTG